MDHDTDILHRIPGLHIEKTKIHRNFSIIGKSGISHSFDYFIEDKNIGILVVDFLDIPTYVKAIATNIDTGIKIIIVANKVDPDVHQFIDENDRVEIIDKGKIKITVFIGKINKVMK